MATLTSQCLAFVRLVTASSVNQFNSNKSVKFTFLEFHSLLANPITELESLLNRREICKNNQGRRACVEEASLSATEAKRRQQAHWRCCCLPRRLLTRVRYCAENRPKKARKGLKWPIIANHRKMSKKAKRDKPN